MDDQNLNPHREARLAMIVWGNEYALQGGGVMDFWETLSEPRKKVCREWCDLMEVTPRKDQGDLLKLEVTPFDALSMLSIVQDYQKQFPMMDGLVEAYTRFEHEITKKISNDQISEAQTELDLKRLFDKS